MLHPPPTHQVLQASSLSLRLVICKGQTIPVATSQTCGEHAIRKCAKNAFSTVLAHNETSTHIIIITHVSLKKKETSKETYSLSINKS